MRSIRPRSRRAALRFTALLTFPSLLAGCDPVTLTEGNSARVRVEAPGGAAVLIVTSSEFFVAQDATGSLRIDLFSADTAWQAPPYDRTFDIRETNRFLVRALASEPPDASVLMRVWIDGEQRHNANQVLSERILEFVFVGR